jgi:hypothetical protein
MRQAPGRTTDSQAIPLHGRAHRIVRMSIYPNHPLISLNFYRSLERL